MSLQLFGKPQFNGQSITVTADTPDLVTTSLNYRASSARLTNSSDRVLLFTETGFRGQVMFRRGQVNIINLGKDRGRVTPNGQIHWGKNGFNNNVRSVKVTPFDVNLKYHYVYDGTNGTNLPGTPEVNDDFVDWINLAAKINEVHSSILPAFDRAMINMVKDPIFGQIDNRFYFDMLQDRSIISDEVNQFRRDNTIGLLRSAINVVFVNDLATVAINSPLEGLDGLGPEYTFDPNTFLVCFVEMKDNSETDNMARTLGHEIGRMLGLQSFANQSAGTLNLMTEENFIGQSCMNALRKSMACFLVFMEQ